MMLITLLSFLGFPSFSQGMYGFGIGLGYTSSYHSYITPAVEGYNLWRLTPHIYAGMALFLQRYSFQYDLKPDPASLSYGSLISIRQKSTYLFLTPKVNFGIGYRNKVIVAVLGGPGVIMAAGQWQNQYQPLLTTSGGPIGSDTIAVNTGYNVPRIIYRAGLSLSKRISTHRYFNIMLSGEFSYLFNKLNHAGPNLYTNYFSFTVGVMHKYPQVWREED